MGVSNEEIKLRMRIDVDIIETIKAKCLRWYGHL